jgi:threonine/homoserine/homoserine lactone efflux protein
MTASTLFVFLAASIALTFAPGPDNLFVVTQGIARGRRAAVLTAWGMCSGITVHTVAAAAGISALFYSSALAFQVVKFAGAGYLIYLACQAVRERSSLGLAASVGLSGAALFRRGFVMNVLNPKVALFFLAFLPQFTNREAGNIPLQMAVLGLVFMAQALVIFTGIGFFSGIVGNWILRRPRAGRWFSWLSAAIFASLGVRLALAQR